MQEKEVFRPLQSKSVLKIRIFSQKKKKILKNLLSFSLRYPAFISTCHKEKRSERSRFSFQSVSPLPSAAISRQVFLFSLNFLPLLALRPLLILVAHTHICTLALFIPLRSVPRALFLSPFYARAVHLPSHSIPSSSFVRRTILSTNNPSSRFFDGARDFSISIYPRTVFIFDFLRGERGVGLCTRFFRTRDLIAIVKN